MKAKSSTARTAPTPAPEHGQSDRFLRSIADHLPGYLSYWDRDDICQFANQRYLDLFGMSMEQVRATPAADLIGAQASAEIAEDVAAVLQGQHRQRERVRWHQGQAMHLWVQFVPDWHDAEVKGYFVLGTDITPLKQAEHELQALNEALILARDRAEAGNLAKSNFLSNVSHEIRTPMNAILGLTHLMQRDNRDPVPAGRLGKLARAAQHLLDVLNDVLDLSKIEAGKLSLEPADFHLNAVLSKVCLLVAEQAKAKGLELVFDVNEQLPAAMHGDEMRLVQALLNLVGNAVKFTASGSVLVRVTPVDDGPAGKLLRFAVRDTGMGVPADRLADLFTLFGQADAGTARRFGGTGLGLAITRRLAELMGGQVGVSSQAQVGSEFWFTARLQVAHALDHGDTQPLMPATRVLLIDDLPEARDANLALALRMGMQATACASVQDAQALLSQAHAAGRPIDLVLLDFPMPGASDLPAVRQLCQSGPVPWPPTVLLTTRDAPTLFNQARQAGCAGVWPKPLLQDEWRTHLLDWRAGEQAQSTGRSALQAGQTPATERRAAGRMRRSFHGFKVLLAEDNPINQEIALELLSTAGLLVDLASDGAQAVKMARLGQYDLILMDVQMPVLGGLQVTREIRRMTQHLRTPIVAMTANAFAADREACLAAGMNDHVAKPVDVGALFSCLHRWLPWRDGAPSAATDEPLAGRAVSVHHAVPTAKPASRFSGIDGLDVQLTLFYLPGRDDILERVLAQFCRAYAQGLAVLHEHIEHGQFEAAHRMVHALRGACGAVGATGLSRQAQTLDELLRAATSGSAPSAALGLLATDLDRSLQRLTVAIQGQLQGQLGTAAVAATAHPMLTSELSVQLGALRRMLGAGEFRANALFQALEPQLRQLHGEGAVKPMAQAVAGFEHLAALAMLDQLMATGLATDLVSPGR